MRPRASRIPGIRDNDGFVRNLTYSSRGSRWLDDSHLVSEGRNPNWKRQYKLRHNWSQGRCEISEIHVAEQPPVPPLLVRLHRGVVFTVDCTAGLRAWSLRGEQKLIATACLESDEATRVSESAPTALAIDVHNEENDRIRVAVGFADGHFGIYELQRDASIFVHQYTHPPSSNGMISAIAYNFPHFLTMTEAQLLSLYCFEVKPKQQAAMESLHPPRLLSSLRSHTVWPPLSLSLRGSSEHITASIAYALPTYLSGWSVGLQELRLTLEGDVLESRLASAIDQGFQPFYPLSSSSPSSLLQQENSATRSTLVERLLSSTKPTSLSYSHPYLLASHPDNTLSLYMVTSTTDVLSIGNGRRLWGHTTSVSGAHVGDRGKAVSVSSRGDELRVWELEGGLSKRRVTAAEESVEVRAGIRDNAVEEHVTNSLEVSAARNALRRLGDERHAAELAVAPGWVGFDEEKVVVLHEKGLGTQALIVYDFT